MQPESGRSAEPSGDTLLPPALTQWRPFAEPADGPDAPLAPFIPGLPAASREEWESAPGQADLTAAEADWDAAPEQPGSPADEAAFAEDLLFPADAPAHAEDRPFEDDAALASSSPHTDEAAEEETLVLLEEAPENGYADRRIAEEVADRLEVLAGRLRRSGLAALDSGSGDVDTVLAAVLSGYVAARAR